MSYEAVLTQVREAPEECLEEISQIIRYVVFRHEKKTAAERFAEVAADAQAWAKEVGMTEQDVASSLKEMRLEKRRAVL